MANKDITTLPISKIKPNAKNPRFIRDEAFINLVQSVKDFPEKLEARPIVLNQDNMILGGNMRFRALKEAGVKEVPVMIVDWPEEKQREFIIKDNVSGGEWDWDVLANEWDKEQLTSWGLEAPDDWDKEKGGNDDVDPYHKLTDRFIFPPFSVLDARQGYWQDRKREWFSLGIKSEEGRESGLTLNSLSGAVPDYYSQKRKAEQKLGRELDNKEFEEKYLDASGVPGNGTSVFDPVLCEIAYHWFNIDGGSVIDPFAGGSVRGIVAARLGYPYTGHELSEAQVIANRKQAEVIVNDPNDPKPEWIIGDSNKTLDKNKGQYDFLFTCPPYADLEVYSDDPDDISNMPYDQFLEIYASILKKGVSKLKDNRFAMVVVGEVRSKKDGTYRNFVQDTINAMTDAGMHYYNEIILVTSLGSLPMRAGRQFQSSRKVGKTHQNALVFYKGDIEAISDNFRDTREVQQHHQNLLVFYKGDPKRVDQHFGPIEIAYQEPEGTGEDDADVINP